MSMLYLIPPGEYEFKLTKNNILVNIDGAWLCLPRLAFASCITCARFNSDDTERSTCAAYPKGIPPEIIQGHDRHKKSNGDDNGLFYEPQTRTK